MRDYKFRGKPKDPSAFGFDFVYGSLLQYQDTDEHEIMTNDLEDIPVIPETVGQFTGLKDCNGKEIYSGDLIRVFAEGAKENYHDSIEVIYSWKWAEFKCVAAQSLSHYIQLYYQFEVIGTIHDK